MFPPPPPVGALCLAGDRTTKLDVLMWRMIGKPLMYVQVPFGTPVTVLAIHPPMAEVPEGEEQMMSFSSYPQPLVEVLTLVGILFCWPSELEPVYLTPQDPQKGLPFDDECGILGSPNGIGGAQ
jgi:hypothetical protein